MENIFTKSDLQVGKYIQQQRVTKEIQHMVANVHEWLLRANFYDTRKFFLGIIHRINNVDLLQQIIRVLSSVKQKDFTYSRSQCNSSLLQNRREFSSNKHRMTSTGIESQILKVWSWFSSISDANKTSFLFCISTIIDDSTILHQALNLAKTVYIKLRREQSMFNDDSSYDEACSLPSTTHTFHTDEHPDIYMLAALNTQYRNSQKQIADNFSKVETLYTQDEFENQSSSSSFNSTESSLDPRVTIVSNSNQALSGVSPFIDYISELPVHLAKKIVSFLDLHSQCSSAGVNKMWHDIIRQVQLESRTRREIREEAVMMQGVSSKGAHPNYAKKKLVTIPVFSMTKQKRFSTDQIPYEQSANADGDNFSAIPGLTVARYEMEERNVYCGSYNVLILDKQCDNHRVVHYSGGNTIISGSNDRIIKLFDVNSGQEISPSIRGHPGSITSVFITNDDDNYIFSGSYDTTIRRWHQGSSSCRQILHGHRKSVTTLDYFNGMLASGANDGLIKVWNVSSGKCICTFKHAKCSSVTCVKIHQNTIVSSCERGIVKVWDISTRKLVKRLMGHTDAVPSVCVDDHYIVSASHDGYVLAWVKDGNVNQPIKSYRHPKKVLCVELRYLRIISGCEDGKIRVLHLHTGECLRVVRGNSKCDPIVSICATPNRLIVNTISNVLLLQFEPVSWEYDLKRDRMTESQFGDKDATNKSTSDVNYSYPYIRACRSRASSITNIRNRPISAPVKKQKPSSALRRPVSSFPCLASYTSISSSSPRHDLQRPWSNYSNSKYSLHGRAVSESCLNVHDSTAMSVISGISSIILQDDAKSDGCLTRKPPSRFIKYRENRRSSSSHLSRDRLHLRIGSIYHNTRNNTEDVNTALNGGHPDIREIFHGRMMCGT